MLAGHVRAAAAIPPCHPLTGVAALFSVVVGGFCNTSALIEPPLDRRGNRALRQHVARAPTLIRDCADRERLVVNS